MCAAAAEMYAENGRPEAVRHSFLYIHSIETVKLPACNEIFINNDKYASGMAAACFSIDGAKLPNGIKRTSTQQKCSKPCREASRLIHI